MSIEAMKQALEALDSFSPYSGNTWIQESEVDIDSAITALRQAIERAEKQEPVAWMSAKEDMTYLNRYEKDDIPLYLHPAPPKPEWVGLTDEELERITFHHLTSVGDYWVKEFAISERHIDGFAEAISAKLKEKNHG